MRIRADRLDAELGRKLLPVYVVSGDEPLSVAECLDSIRTALRRREYTERKVHWVARGFDWSEFSADSVSMSLFAARRFLEVRLTSSKPGDAGTKALLAYAERPPEDTVLVLSIPKLDKAAFNTKWIKALDGVGAIVQVWPVDDAEFPVWVSSRMKKLGLAPTREAVLALSQRVEGNLLAAQQEIEKIWLQKGEGAVSVDDVESQVGDSARFNVFKLADTAVSGNIVKALRILGSLRSEGVEPVLIAWALTREIRSLASMKYAIDAGQSVQSAIAAAHVWNQRQGIVRSALSRHSGTSITRLLAAAAHADRAIKGRAAGSAWDALLGLVAGLCSAAAPLARPA